MILTVQIYSTLPHNKDKIQLKKCGTNYEIRKKGFCGQHWTFAAKTSTGRKLLANEEYLVIYRAKTKAENVAKSLQILAN